MSTVAERVAEFLRQWAMMRDKSHDIYDVLADPDGEMATLTTNDLHAVLDELTEQRELLDTLLAPKLISDTELLIHGSTFGVQAGTPVRFHISPDGDYVQVEVYSDLDGEGWVRLRSSGRLSFRPEDLNEILVKAVPR